MNLFDLTDRVVVLTGATGVLGTLHWLASDASKAVTGTVAVVDGGFASFNSNDLYQGRQTYYFDNHAALNTDLTRSLSAGPSSRSFSIPAFMPMSYLPLPQRYLLSRGIQTSVHSV